MLSICIPIYNFDMNRLVSGLAKEILDVNSPVEIVLIDDSSDPFFIEKNEAICSRHTYIKLNDNVGRSRIRNLFLDYVSYEYMLFLDCDAIIISDDFVKNYIDVIRSIKPSVACGGRVYPARCPSLKQSLSWKYGVGRESKSVEERSVRPNHSFMTNNFLIDKTTLTLLPFDESLVNYGHEDTLMGYQLFSNGIHILHIDNPILNGDIEFNKEFLLKTHYGLDNLVVIHNKIAEGSDFSDFVHLLNFYDKLEPRWYSIFIYILFVVTKPLVYTLLLFGLVHLSLFDFYKLGIFMEFKKKAYNF